HGAEARGDAAPRLLPFSRTIDDLRATVRDGKGQMPPISGQQVSDPEVAGIAEYLRSLSR
ncbi:MAG: cytochrome c, partial [Vicinamibacterales bacterium]